MLGFTVNATDPIDTRWNTTLQLVPRTVVAMTTNTGRSGQVVALRIVAEVTQGS